MTTMRFVVIVWFSFASAAFAEDAEALKSLEEVKGLLKKVENKSAELEKLNSVLAAEERKVVEGAAKPDQGTTAPQETGCGEIKSFEQIKDCFLKAFRDNSNAVKELSDEM